MALRYYQKEAIAALHASQEQRNLLLMFCGCGKTRIVYRYMVESTRGLSIVVFPSIALITQFNQDYMLKKAHARELAAFGTMSVCSVDECGDTELSYTTDEDHIARFLNADGKRILTVTYQSYPLVVRLVKQLDIKVDNLIYDEAHHTVADKIQDIVYNDPDYDSLVTKIVFMTATPKNTDDIIMHDWDFPEKSRCGALAYHYSHIQGVDDGFLNDFEIMVYFFRGDSDNGLLDTLARSIVISENTHVLTFHFRSETVHDERSSVIEFMEQVDNDRFAATFASVLDDYPDKQHMRGYRVTTRGLTAKTKNKQRVINAFNACKSDEVFVLSSCRTIGEGVDTRNANMCTFVDPKQSYIDIVQNIGRVTRRLDGTVRKSTVLIPCFVDATKYEGLTTKEEQDAQIRRDMTKDGDFGGILNVLAALRQTDQELYDACLAYPDRFTRYDVERSLRKQGCEMVEVTSVEELGLSKDELEQLEEQDIYVEELDIDAIKDISDALDRPLEIHTNSLEHPIVQHNDCEGRREANPLIVYHDEDDEILYLVKKRDSKSNKKPLAKGEIKPPTKRKVIDVHRNSDIRVLWSAVSDLDATKDLQSAFIEATVVVNNWMERYEQLKTWIEANGRLPSHGAKCKYEKSLGSLCHDFRHRFKKGKLSQVRISRLEALPIWSWNPIQDSYKNMYLQVKTFIMLNKRLPSTESKCSREKAYGWWCCERRKNYRANKLSQQYIDELEQIPLWSWDPIDTQFQQIYATVKDWVEINRRLPAQHVEDYNENWLSIWCKTRRDDYKLGKLSHERIISLEQIPFWTWHPKEKQFHQTYQQLKSFIEKNRRLPLKSTKDPCEKTLTSWCTHRRKEYKAGKLSQERIAHLEQLPLWSWDPFEDQYQQMYAAIKAWIQANGRLPSQNTNKTLYTWCSSRRKDYKANTLSQERIAHLEQLPFWYWSKDADTASIDETAIIDETASIDKTASIDETASIDKTAIIDDEAASTVEPSDESDEEETPVKKKVVRKRVKQMTLRPQPSAVDAPAPEKPEQRRQRVKSKLSELHQRYKTLTSANLHEFFRANPSEWHEYHRISEENESSFPDDEVPYRVVARELSKIKRDKIVADLGCGTARLCDAMHASPNLRFHNFDHVSMRSDVIACDVKRTPLDDDSVDVVVLCLALWGSNCSDYIKEANRILDAGGTLIVLEPFKRWNEDDGTNRLKDIVERHGFTVIDVVSKKFMTIKAIKIASI